MRKTAKKVKKKIVRKPPERCKSLHHGYGQQCELDSGHGGMHQAKDSCEKTRTNTW